MDEEEEQEGGRNKHQPVRKFYRMTYQKTTTYHVTHYYSVEYFLPPRKKMRKVNTPRTRAKIEHLDTQNAIPVGNEAVEL